MPVPVGGKTARWNQAVNGVSSEMGWTQTEADAWLTNVWNNMYNGGTAMGQITAYSRLRTFLEANKGDAPTLPNAFEQWVMR